jgi:4-hydroxyproline epimerase
LGMCGHGSMGLVATLAHLGRVQAGALRIETPVGVVGATLHDDGSVTVANVPAYRWAKAVRLSVPGHGVLTGDVAWGGNWFFLCDDHGLDLSPANIPALSTLSEAIKQTLKAQGITGENAAEIDHIELLGPAQEPQHQGRSFVMCPGGAYDRSPCGTGTSAKLACLAADGKLAPGEIWHQESVIGSVFSAHYARPAAASAVVGAGSGANVLPFIRGRAHVTLDATVVFDPSDPFAWGLPPP